MSLAECSKFVRFFSHTAVSAAPLNGSSQISHYSVLVRNRKRKNSGHAAFPVSQTHAFSHLFSRTRPFGAQTRFHRCWQCARKPGLLAISEFFLFRSVLRYIRFLLTPSAPLKTRTPRNVKVFSFSFRPALYTFLADAGRTPCRNIVCHLERPDQAPRKLEGAG